MIDWFHLIVPFATTGGSVGGGFYAARWFVIWLTARHDKKAADLAAEHSELDQSWKKYRITLEQKIGKLEQEIAGVRYSFLRVSHALAAVDPDNPALAETDALMRVIFPPPYSLEADRSSHELNTENRTKGLKP